MKNYHTIFNISLCLARTRGRALVVCVLKKFREESKKLRIKWRRRRRPKEERKKRKKKKQLSSRNKFTTEVVQRATVYCRHFMRAFQSLKDPVPFKLLPTSVAFLYLRMEKGSSTVGRE